MEYTIDKTIDKILRGNIIGFCSLFNQSKLRNAGNKPIPNSDIFCGIAGCTNSTKQGLDYSKYGGKLAEHFTVNKRAIYKSSQTNSDCLPICKAHDKEWAKKLKSLKTVSNK